MPRSNNSTQNKIKQDNPSNTKQIHDPKNPPSPQISTPSSSNSYGSGFVDSMVSGFGFGVGSSLARKVFEPTKSSEPQNTNITVPVSPSIQPTISTSDDIFNKYMECLQRNEPTENCEMILEIKP